jgi:CPA2 family monovalent cation:H+ antiporter-2
MHDPYAFLRALTIVLCVAAVTTVIFHRLRQPVVLGYILAGLIIGPHLPVPLVADAEIVHTLSELGVILLMFSLGLEFSIRRIAGVGATAGVTGLIQCSLLFWMGFVAGQLLGWTTIESLFAGAIIVSSSTTIIAKAFEDEKVRGKLREIVVAILLVEDLIAILLMALLTAVATGHGASAGALLETLARLTGFLVALMAIGLLVVPRVIRFIVALGKSEMLLVASIGICFGVALLAHAFGYSVALGAFIAGSLIAESGEAARVEHLVQPVRDMFAAVFFVSVGMLIDPQVVAGHWRAVAIFAGIVVSGKVVGVAIGVFLTGNGTRLAVRSGMALAQIGEFSFIVASLGISLRATRDFLFPIAVAVSALTTLLTPWFIRGSDRVAAWVDRKLPRSLQTLTALHASWVERMRSTPRRPGAWTRIRQLLRRLALDVALLTGLVVTASLLRGRIAADLAARLGIAPEVAHVAVLAGAVALSIPLLAGIFRVARRLGASLAELALPRDAEGKVDLATAPRRALVVALQLAVVLAAGLPIVAVTEPFLPSFAGALVFLAILLVLGLALWRRATSLQGHVRAGAQVIVEALASRAAVPAPPGEELAAVRALLPGIGEPVTVRVEPGSPAIGKTLGELNLRGVTGASVLAIGRAGGAVLLPTAREPLQAGDLLALAGSQEAIAAARELLARG